MTFVTRRRASRASTGFTDATFGEQIALIHSELSEALEDYRSGLNPGTHTYLRPDGSAGPSFAENGPPAPFNKPCGIPSELADVLIRVFHLAGQYGIDLDRAVREKMLYNETRPYKHGKRL